LRGETKRKRMQPTFCWCFKGKAVGYWALTIEGPLRENIGELIAPYEITWKNNICDVIMSGRKKERNERKKILETVA